MHNLYVKLCKICPFQTIYQKSLKTHVFKIHYKIFIGDLFSQLVVVALYLNVSLLGVKKEKQALDT